MSDVPGDQAIHPALRVVTAVACADQLVLRRSGFVGFWRGKPVAQSTRSSRWRTPRTNGKPSANKRAKANPADGPAAARSPARVAMPSLNRSAGLNNKQPQPDLRRLRRLSSRPICHHPIAERRPRRGRQFDECRAEPIRAGCALDSPLVCETRTGGRTGRGCRRPTSRHGTSGHRLGCHIGRGREDPCAGGSSLIEVSEFLPPHESGPGVSTCQWRGAGDPRTHSRCVRPRFSSVRWGTGDE